MTGTTTHLIATRGARTTATVEAADRGDPSDAKAPPARVPCSPVEDLFDILARLHARGQSTATPAPKDRRPGGDPVPPGLNHPRTLPTVPRPLTMIDLFAGCGGLTSGFVSTGRFEPVVAVEKDLSAAATYAANFGEDHVHWGSIEDWVRADIPRADVVVGGPPCQGFSNLGRRQADDPRNELWRKYVDTLVAAKPRAFLLENVDRFGVSAQFRDLVAETEPGGRLENYRIGSRIVRATEFGAAQARRRFIVIGTRRDVDQIPVPTGPPEPVEGRSVADALAGLDPKIDWMHRDLPEGTAEFFGQTVQGVFKAPDLHVTRFYTGLSLRRFRYIPEGGNRLNLPDSLKAPCWLGHDKGSLDVMGRMRWERPSVTIRTEFFKPEKGRYLHPDEHRAISHHEAARLQGFDDDFQWCGSKLQIARQIGNAVPVELSAGLAAHLAACLD
jgi:DNA (cytosine-5)-methyltransferase 1